MDQPNVETASSRFESKRQDAASTILEFFLPACPEMAFLMTSANMLPPVLPVASHRSVLSKSVNENGIRFNTKGAHQLFRA